MTIETRREITVKVDEMREVHANNKNNYHWQVQEMELKKKKIDVNTSGYPILRVHTIIKITYSKFSFLAVCHYTLVVASNIINCWATQFLFNSKSCYALSRLFDVKKRL